MGKRSERSVTSQHGFIPGVLQYDGLDYFDTVLDGAYVEFGTGCWIDKGNPLTSYEAQSLMYASFVGPIEEGHVVVNSCNDYRVCYNPNCLITLDIDDINGE